MEPTRRSGLSSTLAAAAREAAAPVLRSSPIDEAGRLDFGPCSCPKPDCPLPRGDARHLPLRVAPPQGLPATDTQRQDPRDPVPDPDCAICTELMRQYRQASSEGLMKDPYHAALCDAEIRQHPH
ncbi:hypothetical protein [Streptomyces griseus]|uniref:hypothetical protein n=1 Tax=Streptomyces griseus TaxID=1911 RepID=UPI0033D24B43